MQARYAAESLRLECLDYSERRRRTDDC